MSGAIDPASIGAFVGIVVGCTILIFVVRHFTRRAAASRYGILPEQVTFRCGVASWVRDLMSAAKRRAESAEKIRDTKRASVQTDDAQSSFAPLPARPGVWLLLFLARRFLPARRGRRAFN
jgi:hypothetical protein